MTLFRKQIARAAERIAPWVRHTGFLCLGAGELGLPFPLTLKLELLRHTGSFKPRGAFNRILAEREAAPSRPPAWSPPRAAITAPRWPMLRGRWHCPPLLLLLLHGGDDSICYPRNPMALAARVQAAGRPPEVRPYQGVGHIGLVLGFAPLFRARSPVFDDVSAFVLGAIRKPGCAGL